MPNVVVIAGPNGSGKSTAAPHLLRDFVGIAEFVNADVIAQGLAAFDVESVSIQAGKVMLNRLRELADQQVSFAFETTLASRTFARFLADLRTEGYRTSLFFLYLPSPELSIARVARRVELGGHHVPDDVVRRRYRRGLENFFRLYRPIVNDWEVLDNSGAHGYQEIAREGEEEPLRVINGPLWKTIQEAYA